MGWVQKTDEQLEDLKTIVDVNDEVIHDLMAPAKAFQLRVGERVALMIHIGIHDHKVIIEPARLPPGKITEKYGKALAEEPYIGKKWQVNGFKVPNEENTTLGELLDDGQDGVCVNLKVSREDDDWYAMGKDIAVDFEAVVEFIQLANILPMLEPIARMIPDELLRDTAPVSEVLKKNGWPKTKTFSVTPALNQINSSRMINPHLIVAMVATPTKLFGNYNRTGQERNIGYYLKSQFVENVNISYDENGPKGEYVEILLDAEYDIVKKVVAYPGYQGRRETTSTEAYYMVAATEQGRDEIIEACKQLEI